MKICSKCKIEKEFSLFYKKKGGKDGLSSRCNVCVKEKIEIWRKLNPEKLKAQSREWRINNPERYKELQRSCREVNSEQNRESRKISSINLSDEYVKKSITRHSTICRSKISPELIALKRAHLQLTRELKSMEQQS